MAIVTETSTGTFSRVFLGRTGREVARLGVSASYGVPGEAVERAFEQGVNYLYWGSMRRDSFGAALRRLSSRRDQFALVIQSYTRAASLMGWSLERALRALRFDYTDVLLLGMWNRPVAPRILDAAQRLKARGLVRYLAVSTHTRALVPATAAGRDFDIVHFRYNAAHPGAETDIFPHLPDAGPVSYTHLYGGRFELRSIDLWAWTPVAFKTTLPWNTEEPGDSRSIFRCRSCAPALSKPAWLAIPGTSVRLVCCSPLRTSRR